MTRKKIGSTFKLQVLRSKAMIEDNSMPEPNSGCWLWLRSVDKDGYALLGNRPKYGHRIASRYAYDAFFCDPGELLVCHSCDNPLCVNPAHLFLGTHKDNTRDMLDKGRAKYNAPRGVDAHNAKLNADIVRFIRANYVKRSRNNNLRVISKTIGIDYRTAYDAAVWNTWKDVR